MILGEILHLEKTWIQDMFRERREEVDHKICIHKDIIYNKADLRSKSKWGIFISRD